MVIPSDFLYLVAYSLGVSQYVIKERRPMMVVRTVSSALFIWYMYLLDARTGIIACAIATLGSFMQAIFPDRLLAKTRFLRTSFAVILALTAIFTLARTPADLFPLIAVINARLAEIQANIQRIRLGLLISQGCWFSYHYSQEFWLMLAGETLAILINLTTIWRHEQQRKKAVPVPVRLP